MSEPFVAARELPTSTSTELGVVARWIFTSWTGLTSRMGRNTSREAGTLSQVAGAGNIAS